MNDELGNWNRSHEWVVKRIHRTEGDIWAIIGDARLADQLSRIRKVSSKFRDLSPTEVKRQIVNGRIHFGRYPSIQCKRIQAEADKCGLQLEIIPINSTSYLRFDKTTGLVWLIEDDSESTRIAMEMIAAGATVEEIEID